MLKELRHKVKRNLCLRRWYMCPCRSSVQLRLYLVDVYDDDRPCSCVAYVADAVSNSNVETEVGIARVVSGKE